MRTLKTWERNYCGSDDPEIIKTIFVKRHKRAVVLFLAALIPLFFLSSIFDQLGISKDGLIARYIIVFQAFLMFGAVAYVMLRYRCPRCNAVPNSSQLGASGILLFPKKCAKCGALLMPDHRWAQE